MVGGFFLKRNILNSLINSDYLFGDEPGVIFLNHFLYFLSLQLKYINFIIRGKINKHYIKVFVM